MDTVFRPFNMMSLRCGRGYVLPGPHLYLLSALIPKSSLVRLIACFSTVQLASKNIMYNIFDLT